MDLTPPSLTGSPYSPGNKHLDSPPPYHTYNYMSRAPDGSYAHLPSLESSCDTPSSYTIIDPGLADAFDIGSPFAPSESIPPSIEWPAVPSTTSPPSSTTSSMLPRPSDYGQFGYESSGISNSPYQAASTYSRTASLSPAYMATPPMPASDGAERFPHMFSSRPPLASSPALGGASSSPYGNVANSSGFVSSSLMPPSSLHMATTSHPGPQMLLPEALQPHQVPIHPHVQPGTHIRGFNTSASPVPPAAGPPPRLVPSSDLARSHNANQSWDTSKKDKGRHPRRHTTKEEANYQCNVKGCGKFFSRNYNYKSHMETHDEKREYPFPCQEPDCTKKFVRRTDLQRHHQSVHAKERAHKCDYCGRTFARKDTRRRHMEDGCPNRFDFKLEATAAPADVAGARAHKARSGNGDLDTFSTSLRSPTPLAPTSTLASQAGLSLGRARAAPSSRAAMGAQRQGQGGMGMTGSMPPT